MVEVLSKGTDFAALLPVDDSTERNAALANFVTKGWPNRHDEEFRFTPLRELAEWNLQAPRRIQLESKQFDALPVPTWPGPRLVFVNGFFDASLSDLADCGITLRAGQVEGLGTVSTYEGKLGSTNDPRFVELNKALSSDAAIIEVSPHFVETRPIQILYVTVGTGLVVSPRVWIHVAEGAQASVVETYVGTGGAYFTNAVTEVTLERDAMLEHTRIQHESRQAYHIAHVWAHQESGSTYTSNSVQFGAKVGRIDVNVWLNGEHTETWLNGAYVGKGEQVLDNKTRIDHAMPNCHSFEVYKGILDDESRGVFNGKIFVYEDAQKTDAKQTNQALLLSDEATIDTKPQLEIFADDVKCTHGATIGQLRDDQMFYLKSRGIGESEARNMLVYAFVAEVLEKISVDVVRSRLEQDLFEKLNS